MSVRPQNPTNDRPFWAVKKKKYNIVPRVPTFVTFLRAVSGLTSQMRLNVLRTSLVPHHHEATPGVVEGGNRPGLAIRRYSLMASCVFFTFSELKLSVQRLL